MRVNAIILGGVHSEQQALSTAAFARWVLGREPEAGALARATCRIPLDVARALALLCHDDARMITGATIAIDRAHDRRRTGLEPDLPDLGGASGAYPDDPP